MNLFSDEVSATALVILGIILFLSLFIERPFCSVKASFYQVKDLKTDFDMNEYKVNANSVKMFIAFYKGYPFDLSNAQSQFTETGANILKEQGSMLPEQLEYLENHIISLK